MDILFPNLQRIQSLHRLNAHKSKRKIRNDKAGEATSCSTCFLLIGISRKLDSSVLRLVYDLRENELPGKNPIGVKDVIMPLHI